MVPMRGIKVVESLHESTVRSPGFSRSGPPEGGTPNRRRATDGFVEALHETYEVRLIGYPQ